MSQRNKKSICPYCMAEGLSCEKMIPYFEDNHPDNIFHRNRFGADTTAWEKIIRPHNRSNGGYKRHWGENEPGGSGVLIHWGDVVSFGEPTDDENVYTLGDYIFTYAPHLTGHIRVRLKGVRTVEPVALLCPECESFFPLNYFDVDCKYIMLAGRTSVGKSVYACSLFHDDFVELKGAVNPNQDYTLDVSFPTIDFDSRTKAFHDAVGAYSRCTGDNNQIYCVLPPETKGSIPPIFLTMTWVKPTNGRTPSAKYAFNLCLIDTEGESWVRTNRDGAQVPVEYTELADAVLYLVEPAQGEDYLPDRSKHFAAPTLPGPGARIPDEEEKADAKEDRKTPGDYSTIYTRHFSDQNRSKEIIGAFVLTKSDKYLRQPYQSTVRRDIIPYFDFLIDTGNTSTTRPVLLDFDRTGLHIIAAFQLIQTHFSRLPVANPSFSRSACFAVSAFTGTTKTVYVNRAKQLFSTTQKDGYDKADGITMSQRKGAFNIHEPFMWILSQMFPDGFPAPSGHTEGIGSDETDASPFDTEARGRDRSHPSDSERTYESVEPEDVFYTAKPAEPITRSVRRAARPTSNALTIFEKNVSPKKDDKAVNLDYSRFFETSPIDESESVPTSEPTTDNSDTDGFGTAQDASSKVEVLLQKH